MHDNPIAAQPSPGGQGDALAIIEEFVQCATLGRPHGKLIAQAKDYLAAGQPVDSCTESECKRCRTHPDHRGGMEHAGISDFRQPVGSDAVSERDLLASAIIDAAVKSGIYRDGVLMSGPQLLMACDDMAECIKSAQTGDLSAVREAVRKAWQKCAAGESIDTQFGTLLDLIDSTR